jgi:hypothetical protein
MVEFTHLRISFRPLSPKPIRLCGFQAGDWPKLRFIPAFAAKIVRQSAILAALPAWPLAQWLDLTAWFGTLFTAPGVHAGGAPAIA